MSCLFSFHTIPTKVCPPQQKNTHMCKTTTADSFTSCSVQESSKNVSSLEKTLLSSQGSNWFWQGHLSFCSALHNGHVNPRSEWNPRIWGNYVFHVVFKANICSSSFFPFWVLLQQPWLGLKIVYVQTSLIYCVDWQAFDLGPTLTKIPANNKLSSIPKWIGPKTSWLVVYP